VKGIKDIKLAAVIARREGCAEAAGEGEAGKQRIQSQTHSTVTG
jgi:hypothetical protein